MDKNLKKTFYFVDWVAVILLLVGGINWGLVGMFNYNLVQALFGNLSWLIYSIVGLLSLWVIGRSMTKTYMKK